MDARNAEQNRERKINLGEVYFEKKGNKYANDKCKDTENTRELHLELVGDQVTYVRVY